MKLSNWPRPLAIFGFPTKSDFSDSAILSANSGGTALAII
jgi:hypothetical protein